MEQPPTPMSPKSPKSASSPQNSKSPSSFWARRIKPPWPSRNHHENMMPNFGEKDDEEETEEEKEEGEELDTSKKISGHEKQEDRIGSGEKQKVARKLVQLEIPSPTGQLPKPQSASVERDTLQEEVAIAKEMIQMQATLIEQMQETQRAQIVTFNEQLCETFAILWKSLALMGTGLLLSELARHESSSARAYSTTVLAIMAPICMAILLGARQKRKALLWKSVAAQQSSKALLQLDSSLDFLGQTAMNVVPIDGNLTCNKLEILEELEQRVKQSTRSDPRFNIYNLGVIPGRIGLLAALRLCDFNIDKAAGLVQDTILWRQRNCVGLRTNEPPPEFEVFRDVRGRHFVPVENQMTPVLHDKLGTFLSTRKVNELSFNQWIRSHSVEVFVLSEKLRNSSVKAKRPITGFIHLLDLSSASVWDVLLHVPFFWDLSSALSNATLGIECQAFIYNAPFGMRILVALFGNIFCAPQTRTTFLNSADALPEDLKKILRN